MKIYLAGPLGFSEAGRHFHRNELVPRLEGRGYRLLDPWVLGDSPALQEALALTDLNQQRSRLREINREIGRGNAEAILAADLVLAVLDGTDVDSGTAAEIGFAYAREKPVLGYRGDFRYACDNLGSRVNLQVEYFIEASGGVLVDSLEALLAALDSSWPVDSKAD
ncbi:nucleoside 2-deoxyribosyltransferase [Motiliproteus sp. SC1-56]|uniref:nucleoside 2-deoxyribosyltransferase n=1 Tax=Motiliproteus sp. SC1-56 TaxID=2799565 RepID=UPI001A8C3297|nr:nucleoside 2-deoxyribosyltransferase [Motiliproteus sp. SC1-56]